MGKHWRAATRLFRALGIIAGATWNIAVKKPEGETLEHVQQKLYNDLKDLLGIKVVFNEAAAPLERKRPTWYLANHTSYGDFIVLGAALRGTFAGKGEILTWPLVRHIAKAAKYIGLRRSREFNPQSRAKIIKNFNAGSNTIMFPEATIPANEPERNVVTGDEVYMFHAGLLPVIFGEAGEDKEGNVVELRPDVADDICAQAVAIKVIEVNGQGGAHENLDLRKAYTGHDKKGMLAQFWRLLTTKEMTVELTPCPVLAAKDFKDHFELVNEAHRQVAAVIAPDQTMVYPALIPGQDPEKRKAPRPIASAPGNGGQAKADKSVLGRPSSAGL